MDKSENLLMDIWQIDKIILFLIFLVPGFISLRVYDLLVPSKRRDFSKSLFEVISYSAWNYATLFWLIDIIHSDDFYIKYKIWYVLALLFILIIMPIIWSVLFLRLSQWKPIAKHIIHPFGKPWDYIFNKKEELWIIVHLKDGRRIGGKFGKNSFASSSPANEQIYIED